MAKRITNQELMQKMLDWMEANRTIVFAGGGNPALQNMDKLRKLIKAQLAKTELKGI